MKCVKCGTGLNTQMIRADGALQCPNCGAIYRRKKSTDPSQRVAPSGESTPSAGIPAQRNNTHETMGSSTQHNREFVNAAQKNPNSIDRTRSVRAGESATENNKPIVERKAARITPETVASDVIRHKNHSAIVPIILALVVVLGFGFVGYAINHFIDGNTSGIFSSISESKESKEINDLMKRLEKAYNAQDIYALLQLYDPTYTDAMFGMMNLLGLKGDALKSVLPFASQFVSQYNSDNGSDAGTIKVKLLDHAVDGSTGTAKYQVDFSFKNGSKDTLTQTADIVKVDGKWYFSYYPSSTGTSESTQQTVPPPIPVADGLTDADVSGNLYYIKGKKADDKDGWGVINAQGKEIIAPYFANILDFDGNCFAVTLDGSNWGFIDRHGNLICDYQYSHISNPDRQGFYAVCIGEQFGVYNPATGQNVPCQYEGVGRVNEQGLFPAKQQGYWGIVDLNGNARVDFRYQEIGEELLSDRIAVAVNGAWGVIDSSGREIIPLSGENGKVWISETGHIYTVGKTSVANVFNDFQIRLYDPSGKLLLSEVYGHEFRVPPYTETRPLIFAKKDEKYHYLLLDEQGNTLLDSLDLLTTFKGISAAETNGDEIKISKAEAPGLMIVEIYGEPVVAQVVDQNGGYLLRDWIEDHGGFVKLDGLSAPYTLIVSPDGSLLFSASYPSEASRTEIYSLSNGAFLAELPYIVKGVHVFGDTYVCDAGTTLLLDRNGMVMQTYQSSQYKSHGDNKYALLYNGVYYGVLTETGFVGKGVAYSKVSYDEDTRTFTLNDGATQEMYRYNPDKTITQFS